EAGGCKSVNAAATNVTVADLQQPVVNGTPLTFCQGGSVTLAAQPGYSSYLWSNGATTSSIAVSTPGSYSVTVTNAAGCSATSNPVTTSLYPTTPPTITPSAMAFCAGGSVTLTANPSGMSYYWYKSGGGTIGSTQTVSVNQAGTYLVNVTDANS